MNTRIPIDKEEENSYCIGTEIISDKNITCDEWEILFIAYMNDCDSIDVELYGNKENIKVFKISYGNIEFDECDISDELKKAILEYVNKNYAKIVKDNE